MSNSGALRQYINDNSTLPPDVLLGYLTWFDVDDAPYKGQDIVKGFEDFDLNPSFLPAEINPSNAFEKAATSITGHKYKHAGYDAEVLVREVTRNHDRIERHLIREIKDSKNVLLSYDQVGELVFYRPRVVNGKIDFSTARVASRLAQGVTPEEQQLLGSMITDFDAAYHRFRYFYDGQRVRTIFREYLLHLNAIQMKPGVYFCHATRGEELQRLVSFASTLVHSKMTIWPIPDIETLRTEIIQTFEREAAKELAEIVTEVHKIRATRKTAPTAEVLDKLKTAYKGIMLKTTEYSRVLQIHQDVTAAAAELAADSLQELAADVFNANNPPKVDPNDLPF